MLLNPITTQEKIANDLNPILKNVVSYPSDVSVSFEDDTWVYGKGNRKRNVHFSHFDLDACQLNEAFEITLDNGASHTVSFKTLAKIIFLNVLKENSSVPKLSSCYELLLSLAAFMKIQNIKNITQADLKDFYIFALTSGINQHGLYARVKIPSFLRHFSVYSLGQALACYYNYSFVSDINEENDKDALSDALKEVAGLSLKEYKKVGSFDFLTLEVGQYYLDFLRETFENDYLFSFLFNEWTNVEYIKSFYPDGVTYNKKQGSLTVSDTMKSKCIRMLSGIPFDEIKGKSTRWSIKIWYDNLLPSYQKHYKRILSINLEHLTTLAKKLGLTQLHRNDTVELLRNLMLLRYYSDAMKVSKTAETVWAEYKKESKRISLKNEYLNKLTLDTIYQTMDDILEPFNYQDTDALCKAFQTWVCRITDSKGLKALPEYGTLDKTKEIQLSSSYATKITDEVKRIIKAGTTLFMGYTGYRHSEYNFPFHVLRVHVNDTIHDQVYVPFRFKFCWHIRKTQKVCLDREMTSQCYQIILHLNDLVKPQDGEPCLYSINRGSIIKKENFYKIDENKRYATANLNRVVKANREVFCQRYTKFKSSKLKQELVQSCKDVPLFEKLRTKRIGGKQVLFNLCRHMLTSYQENKGKKIVCDVFPELTETYKELFDRLLTNEIKDWLFEDAQMVSQWDVKTYRAFVSDNLRLHHTYPTSHAMRHIFAESVLLRYQGDAGKVVRNVFGHLHKGWINAYLNEKALRNEPDNARSIRVIMEIAKIRFNNHIIQKIAEGQNEGYEDLMQGGYHQYIKRAIKLLNIIPSDKEAMANF